MSYIVPYIQKVKGRAPTKKKVGNYKTRYLTAKSDFAKLSAMSKKKARGTFGSPSQSMKWRGTPFPREMTTQLSYSDVVTVSATTGVPTTYLYSANGLWDCNITGTGHQPRFFDTLCGANGANAPYYSYRVYGSKCTIEVFPKGTDSMGMRAMAGLGLFNTTATGPSSLGEMRERADYKTTYVGYWYSAKPSKITRYGSLKTLFNIKDIKDDDNLVGDSSNNPAKQARWGITICPIDESSSRDYTVNVKITYYVTFFNKNDVVDS